jgi:PAS domain S-box-containing protein
MHQVTLQLVYAATLLACAGSLVITWRQNPTALGPKSWAIGSVLGGVALVIYALTAGKPALQWLSACGSLVVWLGVLFYARGTRQHVGLPASPQWMVVGMVIAAVAMFGAMAMTPSKHGVHITVSSFVFGTLCFDVVATVLRRTETRRAPSWFIAFFFGLFGTTSIVRAFTTSVDLGRTLYDRPIDLALLFVGILGAAASAMGFAMLTIERALKERDGHVQRLEQAVDHLRNRFDGLAAGDYTVRAQEQGTSGPLDLLARRFNDTAAKIGIAFDQIDRQRSVLEATLESMLDGLLLLDAEGRIQRANPAVLALFAAADQPLVGRALHEIVAEPDQTLARSLVEHVSQAPVRERPLRFETPTGELTLTLNASAHRDGSGQVQGAVLVLRDDRDLREAQAQLQMTGRMAAMGTIAAGVAHEINNPLTYVLSNLEFVLEEFCDEDAIPRSELVDEIVAALQASQRGAERVRQIVLDLKALSRSDDDSAGRVDVNGLVQTALAMLDNEIRHHACLDVELGEVPEVRGTEVKLGQVFLNIIQNAAQAIAPGHAHENTIRVRSGVTSGGRVFVEVSDTGTGIAPKHLPRIFDAFFSTKQVGVGTGLGLAISHRAVTSLGGTIEVHNQPGGGACFRVVLPVAEALTPAWGTIG